MQTGTIKDKDGLTIKQKRFCKAYMELGSGVKAANAAYDIGSKGGKGKYSPLKIAGNNLKNKAVRGYLEKHNEEAKARIVELAKNATMEPVRLAANKDICDRTEGKAQQSIDHTTGGKPFIVPEETREQIDDRLKKLI